MQFEPTMGSSLIDVGIYATVASAMSRTIASSVPGVFLGANGLFALRHFVAAGGVH